MIDPEPSFWISAPEVGGKNRGTEFPEAEGSAFGIDLAPGLSADATLQKTSGTKGTARYRTILDGLEMRMVDYGTITMSAPLLSQPGDAFAFDLNKSADDYFDYARTDVHALAQNREATVQSTQISGSVAQDIVAEGRLERQLRTEQQADLDAVENRLIEEQAVSIKRAAIEQTYQAELAAADADTTLDASGKEIAKANAATKKATALLELRREIPTAGTGGVLPDLRGSSKYISPLSFISYMVSSNTPSLPFGKPFLLNQFR